MSLTGVCRLALVALLVVAGFAPAAAAVPDWWTASLGGDAGRLQSTAPERLLPAPAYGEAGQGSVFAAADQTAAIDCLAKAIGYEAANEPLAGRQAVAQVILNRARHKAYPKSVCGVVYQGSGRRTGCQFTFTCDGSLRRALSPRTWSQSLEVARQAIEGRLPPTVGAATHYHADYVAPRWAPSLVKVASIGAHIFYRFPGRTPVDSGGYYPAPSERAGAPAAPQSFSPWGLTPAPVSRTGT